jgi:hypothetical protein
MNTLRPLRTKKNLGILFEWLEVPFFKLLINNNFLFEWETSQ